MFILSISIAINFCHITSKAAKQVKGQQSKLKALTLCILKILRTHLTQLSTKKQSCKRKETKDKGFEIQSIYNIRSQVREAYCSAIHDRDQSDRVFRASFLIFFIHIVSYELSSCHTIGHNIYPKAHLHYRSLVHSFSGIISFYDIFLQLKLD